MTDLQEPRGAVSSAAEDRFIELFAEAFGVEKVQLLSPEHPVQDIYGTARFVDFAIRTLDHRVAFEIDGLAWHHPEAISIAKFEDDLLRQNSLIHDNWQVFRWTDRQLAQDPDQVKEQLILFLGAIPGLLALDDFMPKQLGELIPFELRRHQQEALDALERLRSEGKTIAVITHATGTGKTAIAIQDAKRMGGRTLFLAHRRQLVRQGARYLRELWPERSTGVFMGRSQELDAFNVAGSIQSVAENLHRFPPDAFGYLVIDEAHHATADTYRSILAHFQVRFILGLTATPERADGESVLDIFRDSAHRLSLEEAVRIGELVPIRCLRVETNVDLSRVRFNGIQYNRWDIDERVIVPARDRLIVDTYRAHVPERKAVTFCVNVRHGEELAQRFRDEGFAAESVSGAMPEIKRQQILDRFERGETRVLCACDVLNEGWDCPSIEVLLMARPTLSKVLYLQQLGRGTRKSPGKECLIVIDFVDNATRYNAPLSLHRVVSRQRYRPGSLVLAPDAWLAAEEESLERGETPTRSIEIGLWVRQFHEINLFNWQDVVAGMIPLNELEVELAVAENFLRRKMEAGDLQPDHTLELGQRTYHYFQRDRIESIRSQFNLTPVDDRTIKQLFLEYCREMDMAASYKPVLLLSILASIDERGKASVTSVLARFRKFYEDRFQAGLPVEKSNIKMARVSELDDAAVRRVMLGMPFEKFERRRFLKYDRDLAHIRVAANLWKQLRKRDLAELRSICEESIAKYYERV
jgi:superfamily II DNA or RNA helicase